MNTYQQQILSCNRFTVTSMCIMMYLGSYAYFDFDKNSLHILYLYTQLTITLHLQYHRQTKFQNNKTWHHILSHKFIHDVIYCTSARQQFAFLYNRMCNSKLTIQVVPIIFVQFVHTRVLTIVLPSHACQVLQNG